MFSILTLLNNCMIFIPCMSTEFVLTSNENGKNLAPHEASGAATEHY